MSNQKNYNSIFFLTTLSVYLGLVLVGGSAPVMAHSALTQRIEIQSEAEIKDDLDKKPKEGDSAQDGINDKGFKIAEAIAIFVADLKKLESIDKFNPKNEWIFTYYVQFTEFGATKSFSKNSSILNPWLNTAVEQLVANGEPNSSLAASDFVPNCDGKECRQTLVKVDSLANEFSLSFVFTKQTPERAQLAAESFNNFLAAVKKSQKNASVLPIYENTKAHTENNQVFIVTRLPRASIDALLAKNDAK